MEEKKPKFTENHSLSILDIKFNCLELALRQPTVAFETVLQNAKKVYDWVVEELA